MNNYSILGLKKGATLVEIKTQFRCLSKQLHPDVNGGDKSKTDRFLIISAAYQELLNGKVESSKTSFYKEKEKALARYRFNGVRRGSKCYLFNIYLSNVQSAEISTNNGCIIGEYNTKGVEWDVNLKVQDSLLKGTDYIVKIRLISSNGGFVTKEYKLKKPSFWDKVIDKIF